MFVSVLAAALVLQPVAASGPVDPDLHCMVAFSMVTQVMEKDGKLTADDRAGITGIIMYFVGKLDGRLPGYDFSGEMKRLLSDSSYMQNQFRPDVQRCGAEAKQRGDFLIELGDELQKIAPPVTNKPG